MKHKYVCDCPHGGDHSEDCKDCVYSPEYHLVNGDCVRRLIEPADEIYESPKEVSR